MDINYNKIKVLKRGESGFKNLVYIYVLVDPFSGQVKYVGKANDPNFRLKEHIRKSKFNKSYKDNWIKNLINRGGLPIIEVIDEVSTDNWGFWETYWIEQFRTWGFKLTNIANGGIGGNLGELVNKKISESKKGFKHSIKTKQILSEFRIGKKHKKETIEIFKQTRIGENNPMFGKPRLESSKSYKKVIQLDLNGNFIKEWNGITIASKSLNISRQSITDVCFGRHKTAGGFTWIKKEKYETVK